jgi:tetratricopeptide (TPR) repeat protein
MGNDLHLRLTTTCGRLGVMSDRLFISYSSVDGKEFALRLADQLAAGPPAIPVWLDERELRPGEDWDDQLVRAIRDCSGVIFVMTADSVSAHSACKDEWVRALSYKKPVIPLRLAGDAEMPFRLGSRQYIDFSDSHDTGLARLRNHIRWTASPEGVLQSLKYQLVDADRDLKRAKTADQHKRIQDDIDELKRQIAHQEALIANPQAAERRVQETIDRGLERARTPDAPVAAVAHTKFINRPPVVAPGWFQNRHVETRLIGDFLKDDALRLMVVVGRGGVGKSAMVCRLLRSLEGGQLPDDGGPLAVDGIVYLSNARAFHRVTVPDLYDALARLVPEEQRRRLDALYKNPQTGTHEAMRALLEAFPGGRTIVLLDNFEDVVEQETGRIRDGELAEALRALLQLQPHGVKVILTSRVLPRDLMLFQPGLQQRLDLNDGLEHPYAENILRAMDVDGKVGLRDAPEALLAEARDRTRGFPRALEHLFGILSADRDTPLQELLAKTRRLPPDEVVSVLVGEAFSRLDATAQRVMQALATYRYPVPPAAVDYLLQPYVSGIDSGPVLSRLVNMQFVRRDAGRYYLHQIDRDYADSRIPAGEPDDRDAAAPPFTQFALQHRAAEWFKLARTPRETWKTLQDLAPQLAEFELRCAAEDYDGAAAVLAEIDFDYLQLWGHYRLVTELHERIDGKIADARLMVGCVNNLGGAFHRMAQYPRAIACYERALNLARANHNREDEVVCLGNLGACYQELGDFDRAVKIYEEALVIAHELKDRGSEAVDLGNLANVYDAQGQTARAIEFGERALKLHRELADRPGEALDLINLAGRYARLGQAAEARRRSDDALSIAKDIGYRLIEAAALVKLAEMQLDDEDWPDAIRGAKLAIEIADDAAITQVQKEARLVLAIAHLCEGDLGSARTIAQAGCQYDFPLRNADMSAVFAITALREGDVAVARGAFTTALEQARRLLAGAAQSYGSLDIKGLAQSGLALCAGPEHLEPAILAYQAARAINADTGNVRRVLRQFDALAGADRAGMLTKVRAAAGPAVE